MIPKGNQRGGGQQLATHLMNAFDNDRVEIAEVRGAVAGDLHGAFAEWYAQSKSTDCRKYLYSLSINPDHRQGPFTREHYQDFIARTEKKLGLSAQPRAVVFHIKHGREHCHVVWSRIDGDKGKAIQLSHDRQKLRKVAQEYARAYNITLPPGMRNDRGAARFAFRAAAENLAEKQQQERSGISKQARRELVTKAWRDSADARTFIRALEATGFLLARGDKRAYVLVDLSGEIHSLSRQLNGVKAKDLKTRLSSLDIDKMPTAAAAQDHARQKRQSILLEKERQDAAVQKTTLAERAAQGKAEAQRRRDELTKAQAARRAPLDEKKNQLARKHEAERKALGELQAAKTADIARDRAAHQPKGILAFLARITGYDALTTWQRQRQDRKMDEGFEEQKQALARRHAREMEDFRHRERGLTALDKRERRSLETTLRRETFRRVASPKKEQAYQLTPAQQAKGADFKKTAAEITVPAPPRKRSQDAVKESPLPAPLKPAFAEAAGKPEPAERELTDAQRRALELKRAFNRRAGGREKEGEKDRGREHYRRQPPDFSLRR